MSETPGAELPGTRITLFEHALRLHQQVPDAPLPRDGAPYPDRDRRRPRPKRPRDRRLVGVGLAAILDEHFADPDAGPSALVGRMYDVPVPAQPDEHITAAALRSGERSREAGRWLVRHGTETPDVVAGLALLAATGTADDIPRIQTVGLLSDTFGPLAAVALERLPGGAEALLWMADRVANWGRVYVVEALCRLVDDHPAVRPWLLRRAVDAGLLNGYFAGRLARVTAVHEVMAQSAVDAEVVDHTGRLLHVLGGCEGMGMALARYPHAAAVLMAYLHHILRLGPSAERFYLAALLARNLGGSGDSGSVGSPERWRPICEAYLALLDRDDWIATARAALEAAEPRMRWLAEYGAQEMGLRAFENFPLHRNR